MKKLCEYIGGSTLYGLNTPESDIDYRGVYVHTDPLKVFGFTKEESVVRNTESVDSSFHELTAFLRLATNSNTQTLECLFAPEDAFSAVDPRFQELVLNHRTELISTRHLFKSLRGYLQNELRLATGERTGKLGGKRKETLEKYGFSPKNFSHLIRLAFCGFRFFKTGFYPVRIKDFNAEVAAICFDIKTRPENFTKEELVDLSQTFEDAMVDAYENREVEFLPNYDYIREILPQFYQQ